MEGVDHDAARSTLLADGFGWLVCAPAPVDLQIGLDGPAGPLAVGELVTYTLTLTNASGVPLVGMLVSDTLPAGAAFNTPATTTASDDGQTFIDFTVPSSMLVSGVNVIAVEVHQASGASSDVSFDLEFRARRAIRGVLANDKDNASLPLSLIHI